MRYGVFFMQLNREIGLRLVSAAIMFLFVAGGVIPLLSIPEPAVGTITIVNGDMTVDGTTSVVTGKNWRINGNISVINAGSLTFQDCYLEISSDLGLDGTLGTGDDNIHNITVSGGSTLEFDNCTLTAATNQLYPVVWTDINVADSTITFTDSTIQFPGNFSCDNAEVDILSTTFKRMGSLPSGIADTDRNDDAMSFIFNDTTNAYIADSSIMNCFEYSGGFARAIWVADSRLAVFNSYIDVDFRGVADSDTHNYINVSNGGRVFLFDMIPNLDEQAPPIGPCVVCWDTSEVAVYRFVQVNAFDAIGVPLPNAGFTLYYSENGTGSEQAAHPPAEYFTYSGETVLTYMDTDDEGIAIIPMRSDIGDGDTMPNMDFVGRYKIQGTAPMSAGVTSYIQLEGYPIFYNKTTPFMEYNITFDDLVSTDPGSNNYYDTSTKDILITYSTQNLTGSNAVKDGQVYPSYFGQAGSITISDFGILNIKDTYLDIMQDEDTHFYILVESNGVLNLDNVTIGSLDGEPLNIYVKGAPSTQPRVYAKDTNFDINVMCIRDYGDLMLENCVVNGTLNAVGGNVILNAEGTTFVNGSFIVDDTLCTLENCDINTTAVSITDSEFSASNLTMHTPLMFENNMEGNLSNVRFVGFTGQTLVVKDSAVVEVFYWVTIRVVDTFINPLPGATVSAYEFSGFAINVDPFASDETNLTGIAHLPLLERIITATSNEFKGNYFMNATYEGFSSGGSTGRATRASPVIGGNMEINITIDGAPNLFPSNITTNGSLIQGNDIEVEVTVTNNGEFATSNVDVQLENSGHIIGSQIIPLINAKESTNITFPWTAVYGLNMLKCTVDGTNKIGERDETDNVVEKPITVGYGPDLYPIVEFSHDTPAVGDIIQITAKIGNLGDYDTEDHPVKVEFFIGSPSIAPINTTYISAVRETDFSKVTINYTPQQVGFEQIYVQVTSFYDADNNNDINFSTLEVRSPPDLNVRSSDIKFSNPGPIGVGQTITVNVSIHNDGKSDARDVVVRIYQNLAAQGNQLGDDYYFERITALGSAYLEFTWSSPTPDVYSIIVWVDPEDEVNESDEDNNLNYNTIEVGGLPDLKFETDTLSFTPGNIITEGENLVITVKVSNTGGTKATGIVVRFSIDSPFNPIGEFLINLSNDESKTLIVYWTTSQLVGSEGLVGEHYLFAVIDAEDEIVESNEENNLINKTTVGSKITVLSKADLAVEMEDITFSKVGPLENGENVTIYATVHNWGETTATKVSVEFYDGNPEQDGDLIEWRDIQPTAEVDEIMGGETETITVVWNTKGLGGNRSIYVVLDREGDTEESDVSNNMAYNTIYVKTVPEFSVSWFDLAVQQNGITVENIGKDQSVNIVGRVYNDGDTDATGVHISAFNGDPLLQGQQSVTIKEMRMDIPGGEYVDFSIPYTTTKNLDDDISESQKIFIFVDKLSEFSEKDEMDNSAYTTLTIIGRDSTPDLQSTNITLLLKNEDTGAAVFQGDSVPQGTNISLDINISNIGGVSSGMFKVSIFDYNPVAGGVINVSEALANISVSGLEAEDDLWLHLDADDGAWFHIEDIGKTWYYVLIDSYSEVTEYDESNNLILFNLTGQQKPDFQIWDIDVTTKSPVSGKTMEWTVEIYNEGPEPKQVALTCTLAGKTVNADGGPTQLIQANSTGTWTFSAKPEKAGTLYIKATVDPDDLHPETDEFNNERTESVVVEEPPDTTFMIMAIAGGGVALLVVLGLVAAAVYFLVVRKKTDNYAECSECGEKMPLEATSCPNCGAEFGDEVECGNCGHLMSIGDSVCANCGAVFAEDGGAGAPAADKPKELTDGSETPPPPEDGATPPPPGEEAGGDALDEVVEGQADGEDVAECYMCGSIIPLSAPICPVCGAEFE